MKHIKTFEVINEKKEVNEGINKSALKKQIKIIDKMIDNETGGDGEPLTSETLQDLERERERLEKLLKESVNEAVPSQEDYYSKDKLDILFTLKGPHNKSLQTSRAIYKDAEKYGIIFDEFFDNDKGNESGEFLISFPASVNNVQGAGKKEIIKLVGNRGTLVERPNWVNESLNKSDLAYQLSLDYSGNSKPKITKLNKKELNIHYGYKTDPQDVIASFKKLYPDKELIHIGWSPGGRGGVHSFKIEESLNELKAAPRSDKAIKDLEKQGSEINYLDDADNATKKLWKKAGINPDDQNTVILYSYVAHPWEDVKNILTKHSIDFKELEDPNSAGESMIVFIEESVNEATFNYMKDSDEVRDLFKDITGKSGVDDLDSDMFSAGEDINGRGGWILNVDDSSLNSAMAAKFVKAVMKLGKKKGWKMQQYGDDAIEIFESLNEFGPMKGSGNRRMTKQDAVDRIGELEDKLWNGGNRRAEKEWEMVSGEYLSGEEGNQYWADLNDDDLRSAIDDAESIMKKYKMSESVNEAKEYAWDDLLDVLMTIGGTDKILNRINMKDPEVEELLDSKYKSYPDFAKAVKSMYNLKESVNELRRDSLSGTMAGSIESLEDRKYELKKDVKGARIGDFVNVVLPKGTIIYNLPGGVFADHFSLKNKYASKSSRGPQYFDKPTFSGISIRQTPDTLAAIEKNSKVLESVDESDNWKTVKNKSGDTLKPGKKYKMPRYDGEITFIRFDRDNKTLHLKSNKIGKIRTSIDNVKDMELIESTHKYIKTFEVATQVPAKMVGMDILGDDDDDDEDEKKKMPGPMGMVSYLGVAEEEEESEEERIRKRQGRMPGPDGGVGYAGKERG